VTCTPTIASEQSRVDRGHAPHDRLIWSATTTRSRSFYSTDTHPQGSCGRGEHPPVSGAPIGVAQLPRPETSPYPHAQSVSGPTSGRCAFIRHSALLISLAPRIGGCARRQHQLPSRPASVCGCDGMPILPTWQSVQCCLVWASEGALLPSDAAYSYRLQSERHAPLKGAAVCCFGHAIQPQYVRPLRNPQV
jgi:hypothetical protein